MTRKIARGDVWLVNWNPARGSEQAGIRPALVVQNDIGNTYSSTTIVAAISTKTGKTYPFQVRLDSGEGGLKESSVVKLDQLMTIAQERLELKLGSLSQSVMLRVNEALKRSLGIME